MCPGSEVTVNENQSRNKARKASNTTVSVSMSKEMKVMAKRIADDRGVENISALIRMLLKDELKRSGGADPFEKADESEVTGHRQAPALPLLRRAGVSSFGSRKF